jgi:hypothetical protein
MASAVPTPRPSAAPISAVMLEHREHERVDHPEQADDDGEAEQHVQHRQHHRHVLGGVLGVAGARVELGIAEALDRRGDLRVHTGARVEEREAVLRVAGGLVEGLLGHADVTQQLRPGVVDAAHHEGALGAGGHRDGD